MEPRSSPLLDAHRGLGAKLTEFGGWDMPLQYTGIVAEHNVVRASVGIFDVSHLGKLRVSGPGAGDALQQALTADAMSLRPGRATYALALTESGGCIDDVFMYRIDESEWLVVPNAANVEAVAAAIGDCGGRPQDEWDRWGILAIQGPGSFDLFERAWPGTGASELAVRAWQAMDVFGSEVMVARTGYTGERGFELYVPAGAAAAAFERLLELGGTPVGLGARDTLRLEMGYALYGHEISRDINPLEAGLGWALAWDTPFRGRDALRKIADEGPARRPLGVRCMSRGVPRQGYAVLCGGEAIARVTSGNYSPTLKTGIALALAEANLAPSPGATVSIDARGRGIEGILERPPFVRKP
ncbi:glycine cleavage system aminomethyltransferase GcvT [soil metagenome]